MTREERQQKILTLLEREVGIAAGDLARRFGVSRMTIHRDLESLDSRGLLRRIQGGAARRIPVTKSQTAECSCCDRPLLPHQNCQLFGAGGESSLSCCASCALRSLLEKPKIDQLLVGDLISGKMLPAEEAFFLINSQASPCCPPSLLSFASEYEVTLFQAGFGGTVARLQDAIQFLRIAEDLQEN